MPGAHTICLLTITALSCTSAVPIPSIITTSTRQWDPENKAAGNNVAVDNNVTQVYTHPDFTTHVRMQLKAAADRNDWEAFARGLPHGEPEAQASADYWNKIVAWLEQEQHKIIQKLTKTKWSADYKNLRRCASVNEVVTTVKEALARNIKVRIAGAQHSVPAAVFPRDTADPTFHVKLEGGLRAIEWLSEDPAAGTATVRVGAGCNLGIDPSDPHSTAANSFTRQINTKGYSIPILGGMSHQTLGGYMSTSTAGGTLRFGFSDSLLGFELVDGEGNVKNVTKENDEDEFNAGAVSMGLFGVITHVTLVVQKNYLVKGTEQTLRYEKSVLRSGSAFRDFAENNTYIHALWFANDGVDSVLQFAADQVPTTEPVVPYDHPLKKDYMNLLATATIVLTQVLDKAKLRKFAGFIFKKVTPVGPPHEFCDQWFTALPNDDQAMIDSLLRVQFSELWFDLDEIDDVFRAIQELFANDPDAAGNFGTEFYFAKKSPYWMSMSYARDVVRVDPYFFEHNLFGNPTEYFEKFWKVLLPFSTARLHWGKHKPAVGNTYGNGKVFGPSYFKDRYPKFNQWKLMREKFDPKGTFLTPYWRDLFYEPLPPAPDKADTAAR